jgi:hypothetical protein
MSSDVAVSAVPDALVDPMPPEAFEFVDTHPPEAFVFDEALDGPSGEAPVTGGPASATARFWRRRRSG